MGAHCSSTAHIPTRGRRARLRGAARGAETTPLTQPHRFRFLSARLYLGRSGHAHYLPATRPPRRCLCQSPQRCRSTFTTAPSAYARSTRTRTAFPERADTSCEELGGLAYGFDRDFPRLHRLSRLAPLFVSPQGTGANRYVSVLTEENGDLFATWERSSATRSQPLVAHRLSAARIERLLT